MRRQDDSWRSTGMLTSYGQHVPASYKQGLVFVIVWYTGACIDLEDAPDYNLDTVLPSFLSLSTRWSSVSSLASLVHHPSNYTLPLLPTHQ